MSYQTAPNLLRTLRRDIESNGPGVEDGDCGIILKPDGSYRLFSTGVDKLKENSSTWGEREHQQIRNGQVLTAFCLALSNDQVMSVLLDLASSMIDQNKLDHVARPN